MKYYFGIDYVICDIDGSNYADAQPIMERIKIINKLFDEGHHIVYLSNREFEGEEGVTNTKLIHEQFQAWGCKYTTIILNNPIEGPYINTDVYSVDNFFK